MATVTVCLVITGIVAVYFDQRSVVTAIGEQRTFNLPDGTRVELNTDTRIIVHFDAHNRAVELKSGEAYFSVAHERRPFVVIAGTRRVIAIGTSFVVRRERADDTLTVTLIEGRVAVAPIKENQLPTASASNIAILNAGSRLRAIGNAPPEIDKPSMDMATAWMRGKLIFDNTSLGNAVREFNRYNPAKILLASQKIGEIPIGGFSGRQTLQVSWIRWRKLMP